MKPSDPYARIKLGLESAIHCAIFDNLDEDANSAQMEAARVVETNRYSGGKLFIATLQAVGEVYEAKAKEPQNVDGVTKNTIGALRHVYGMVFARSKIAYTNLSAIRYGANPRNPFTFPMGLVRGPLGRVIHVPKVSPKAFTSEIDNDGQLIISPRYPRLQPDKTSGRRCPAPHVRVSREYSTQPAMLLLAKTVGEVVVSEIYPNQFQIRKVFDCVKEGALNDW